MTIRFCNPLKNITCRTALTKRKQDISPHYSQTSKAVISSVRNGLEKRWGTSWGTESFTNTVTYFSLSCIRDFSSLISQKCHCVVKSQSKCALSSGFVIQHPHSRLSGSVYRWAWLFCSVYSVSECGYKELRLDFWLLCSQLQNMIFFLFIVVLLVAYFIAHRIFVHRKAFTGTVKLYGTTVIVTGRWLLFKSLHCKFSQGLFF